MIDETTLYFLPFFSVRTDTGHCQDLSQRCMLIQPCCMIGATPNVNKELQSAMLRAQRQFCRVQRRQFCRNACRQHLPQRVYQQRCIIYVPAAVCLGTFHRKERLQYGQHLHPQMPISLRL